MKHRIQKITSCVLVLVMLVTMIPMGFLTASAEGADYSIASAADWNALAEQNLDFDGKTVTLTADIDANSTALKTLSADFKGVFDGNGKTISNAIVEGKALIADTMTASATVKNLNLVNVDLTSVKTAGMLVGAISGAGKIEITKVSLDSACSITGNNTSGTVLSADNAGGIIGTVEFNDAAASLTISYVRVDATVTTASGNAGGLIGYDKSTKGTINVQNVAALANVSCPDGNTKGKANGLFGYTYGVGTKGVVTINLQSVLIGGTQDDYAVFYMWNGTVNYSAIYVADGTQATIFGAAAYASWLNNVRTKGLGVDTDRNFITIESLNERPGIMEDDPPESYRMELPKEVAKATDVITMDGAFLYKIGRPEGIPTLDLSNYDTETTFAVKNLADWELIAKSGKDFAGKKVVLDADLDGWDESLSTLSANFAGHFDGQGHTIKNVVVSGGGLIATNITATTDVKIENLYVDRITVNYATDSAGALIGKIATTDANVTIQKITMKNVIVTSGGTTGGLIGGMTVKAETKPVTVNIKQVYVAGIVESTVAQKQAGGLIGNDSSNGTSTTNTVTMNITDTVVMCSVKAISYANGLIGFYDGGNKENGGGVLANAKNWAYLNLSNLAVSGGRDFKLFWMNDGVVNASNIYLADFGVKVFGASAYGSWINGMVTKSIGTPDTRGAITAEELKISKLIDIQRLSTTAIDKMIVKDDNGLLNMVPEPVQAMAVQRSLEIKDGKYAIRFIAFSQFKESEVADLHMTVTATYKDANGVMQTLVFSTADQKSHDDKGNKGATCKLYDFLTVYGEYGVGEKAITAQSFGAEKLAAFTIYNVPVDAANMPEGITFTAQMSYTNSFEQTVTTRAMTVSVDAQGNIVA